MSGINALATLGILLSVSIAILSLFFVSGALKIVKGSEYQELQTVQTDYDTLRSNYIDLQLEYDILLQLYNSLISQQEGTINE